MLRIMAVHLGWVAAELKRQRDQAAAASRYGTFSRALAIHAVDAVLGHKAKRCHVTIPPKAFSLHSTSKQGYRMTIVQRPVHFEEFLHN
jgi:hypothetical protein